MFGPPFSASLALGLDHESTVARTLFENSLPSGPFPAWKPKGVGQVFAACASGVPAPLPLIPFSSSAFLRASKLSALSPSFESLASGVGQRVVGASSGDGRWLTGRSLSFGLLSPLPAGGAPCAERCPSSHCVTLSTSVSPAFALEPSLRLAALAVGQDPEPLPAVGGADVVGSEHEPLRIEPDLGQVTQDLSEVPGGEEPRDVLQERERGSRVAENAGRLRPEVALVRGALPFPGAGEGLAGEAGDDEVDATSPGGGVEGAHVVMDLEGLEGSVPLPRLEQGAAEGVELDGEDASPPEHLAGVEAPPAAGEQVQGAQAHAAGIAILARFVKASHSAARSKSLGQRPMTVWS